MAVANQKALAILVTAHIQILFPYGSILTFYYFHLLYQ